MAKYWLSIVPVTCDVCGTKITGCFYDMATRRGPWASMCPTCALQGVGVGRCGPGVGQKYEKQADGLWLKTEG